MEQTTPVLDPMAETALRSMRDIVIPPSVSWWPETWGWAALAGLFAASLIAWFIVAIRRYRRNAYRREALERLATIEQKLRTDATHQSALQELSLLLKQVSIAAWGRDTVGWLSGNQWAKFLAEHGNDRDTHRLEIVVDDAEYRDPSALKRMPEDLVDSLSMDARHWIEKHHV